MPWRLHLTNRALQRLEILSESSPAVLAAWTQPGRVSYIDLTAGTLLAEKRLADLGSRQPEHWLLIQPELPAPNGQYPAVIPGATLKIHLSQSGQQRLYHLVSGEIYLVTGLQETRLSTDHDEMFVAAVFMPGRERIGLLSRQGRLHIYDGLTPVGISETGLPALDADTFTMLFASNESFYVFHQRSVLRLDADGKVQKRLELHYLPGAAACSQQGRLAVSDQDTNVIRIYDGADLSPLYQRHALDLMTKAPQVQLIADPPPSMVALHTLAVDDAGTLAFALAGVICVTDTSQMLALPPQREPL